MRVVFVLMRLLTRDNWRIFTSKATHCTIKPDEKRLATQAGVLDQATREYNTINAQLKQQLPAFFALKEAFITPCFQTMFTYQHRVYYSLNAVLERTVASNYDMRVGPLPGFEAARPALDEMLRSLTIVKRFATGGSGQSSTVDTGGAPVAAGGTGGVAAGASPAHTDGHTPPPPAYEEPRYGQPGPAQQQQQAGCYGMAPYGGSPQHGMPNVAAMSLGAAAAGGAAYAAAPAPVSPRPEFAEALYDFEAQAPGDLSFRVGDRITIVKKTTSPNDWWVALVCIFVIDSC